MGERPSSTNRVSATQRFGGSRPIGDALVLQQHPLVQGINQQLCFFFADAASLIGLEMLDFPLDLIQLANGGQRLLGNLTLVADMQIKELAPCVRHPAHLGDARITADFIATVFITNQPHRSGLP